MAHCLLSPAPFPLRPVQAGPPFLGQQGDESVQKLTPVLHLQLDDCRHKQEVKTSVCVAQLLLLCPTGLHGGGIHYSECVHVCSCEEFTELKESIVCHLVVNIQNDITLSLSLLRPSASIFEAGTTTDCCGRL